MGWSGASCPAPPWTRTRRRGTPCGEADPVAPAWKNRAPQAPGGARRRASSGVRANPPGTDR
eukprot:2919660-Alexandrium_andersonii.AAC.1